MKDAPPPRPNKRPRLGPSPSELGVSTTPTKGKITKPADVGKPKKGTGLEDEFLQAMQPRTKKGPSWMDDDAGPVASTSTDSKIDTRKISKKKDEGQDDLPATEVMSDLDWLRKHTKPTADVGAQPDQVFEQSDDEGDSGFNNDNVR